MGKNDNTGRKGEIMAQNMRDVKARAEAKLVAAKAATRAAEGKKMAEAQASTPRTTVPALPPIAPELIPLADLQIDMAYQRDFVKSHPLHREDVPFSYTLVGTINVSRSPDGTLHCWDGQNRVYKALQSGVSHLYGFIEPMKQVEQAKSFVEMQQNRKGLKKWEVFKAQLFMGDKRATEIAAALASVGLAVTGTGLGGKVKAVQALEDTYDTFGPEHLELTASVIQNLWPDDVAAHAGTMWTGMALWLSERENKPPTKAMATNLRRKPPELILNRAGTMASKNSKAGFTSGQAKGKAPYVRDEIDRIARRRSGRV